MVAEWDEDERTDGWYVVARSMKIRAGHTETGQRGVRLDYWQEERSCSSWIQEVENGKRADENVQIGRVDATRINRNRDDLINRSIIRVILTDPDFRSLIWWVIFLFFKENRSFQLNSWEISYNLNDGL